MATTSSSTPVLALFVLMNLTLVFAAEWGYSGAHGPSHWADSFPICGSTAQSPIDIVTSGVQTESLGNIAFTGYDTAPTSLTLSNNGHTVVVTPVGIMTISGGGLAGTRTVAQFHFHWGSDGTKGSEHTINGAASPMEMHIVHYDAAYGSLGGAVNKTKGLAVLGFLFEETTTDNPALSEIVKKMPNVVSSSSNIALTPFTFNSLLPSNLADFYRYEGSLTTPTCDQSVEWTVFKEKIKISTKQLEEFRKTKIADGSQQVDNFRPVLALNGRIVKATFTQSSGALSQPTVILMAFTATISAFLMHY